MNVIALEAGFGNTLMPLGCDRSEVIVDEHGYCIPANSTAWVVPFSRMGRSIWSMPFGPMLQLAWELSDSPSVFASGTWHIRSPSAEKTNTPNTLVSGNTS